MCSGIVARWLRDRAAERAFRHATARRWSGWLRVQRMAATPAAADVHGDALAVAEQLNRALGDPGVELLADQPVRHRVVMPVDVDVVVEPDPPHAIRHTGRARPAA